MSVPAPFLGVTDLSAGPGTPVDVAALMPSAKVGPVDALGENSMLDLKVARGSATLDLASHAKFAVQKPRRRKGGPRPDLWAGAGKPLDVRMPLSRRGKVHLLDLRAPVRTPLRKAAEGSKAVVQILLHKRFLPCVICAR